MFGTHWSLLGHRTSGLARVALITLSAFIFSTDYGNRGHSAVIVCSDVWANKPVGLGDEFRPNARCSRDLLKKKIGSR